MSNGRYRPAIKLLLPAQRVEGEFGHRVDTGLSLCCIHVRVMAQMVGDGEHGQRLRAELGGDARSWLNLQTAYDLRLAEIDNAKRIAREVKPAAA